jgi:hypothetical protein
MSFMALEVTEELNRKFDERYVIVSESGCWIWTGALNNHPTHQYGNLPVRRSYNYKAHRYAAARFLKRDLSRNDFVCHTCDVTECVNPNHLYVGSAKTNARDRDLRMRNTYLRGEQHNMCKLTEGQVVEIFFLAGNHRKIAERFGISRPTVTAIKAGRLWKHLTQDLRECADA